MRPLKKSHKRIAAVAILLCGASGGGWALSAQALAAGAARGAAATTVATPPIPPLPAGIKPHAAAPMVAATNAHCGEVVTASLTLNGDLYCPGTGIALSVRAASIAINLNGHTIANDGSGFCVELFGATDTVENGYITNCYEAVAMSGAKDTATKLSVSDGLFGIIDTGDASKVTANTVEGASQEGIGAFGNGDTISGNHTASSGYGIVEGGVKNVLSGNFSDSNSYNGVLVSGTEGTFTGNSMDYNGYDGFLRVSGVAGPVTDGGGNIAHGNDYNTNTSLPPRQCVGIACS